MASIADAEGNLLFYTDGMKFFNSQHRLMENGHQQYAGDSRSTQTSYIFPKPGSKHLYYNFITELSYTNSEFNGSAWTIHYSLVDVNANEGEGKVLSRNQVLNHGEASDALCVFQANDGNSFWLITLESFGSEFHAYKISREGVSHSAVVTKRATEAGGIYTQLKASPDNNFLLVC